MKIKITTIKNIEKTIKNINEKMVAIEEKIQIIDERIANITPTDKIHDFAPIDKRKILDIQRSLDIKNKLLNISISKNY